MRPAGGGGDLAEHRLDRHQRAAGHAALILGIISFALIIAGLIVYTVFLVLEIKRNEDHDTFINAVTHELKTPIASMRLYLQTLQSRDVDEARRREFYDIMLEDAERLHRTVEQVLKAGASGQKAKIVARAPVDMAALAQECGTARADAPPPGRGRHRTRVACRLS